VRSSRGQRRGLIAAGLAVLSLVGGSAATGSTTPLPRVTFITDSVAGAIEYDRTALATLSQGIDLNLQIASCRRVEQDSCPDAQTGVRPPNVVQLVQTLGSTLGPTVIVAVGYNDFEQNYAGNIEDALTELEQAGVKNVLWPTLRAAEHPYLTMNDDIRAAAEAHPEVTVVDWNLYSRSHPDWFQPDGIHLLASGTEAMATLLHTALVGLGIPIAAPTAPVRILTSALPDATDGSRYVARLTAVGGKPPYRWSVVTSFPRGLTLGAAGRVAGVPSGRPGTFVVRVRVTDATGRTVTRRVSLRIRS
jgi:hypothetical protein